MFLDRHRARLRSRSSESSSGRTRWQHCSSASPTNALCSSGLSNSRPRSAAANCGIHPATSSSLNQPNRTQRSPQRQMSHHGLPVGAGRVGERRLGRNGDPTATPPVRIVTLSLINVTIWGDSDERHGLRVTHFADLHWGSWPLTMLSGVVLIAGCGGQSASTNPSASTSTTTHAQTATETRLSAPDARRIESICLHSETPEDQNIIVQFAIHGFSLSSPSEFAALKTASTDVAREGKKVRSTTRGSPSSTSALTSDMAAEAQVLGRIPRFIQPRTAEAALLAVLRSRRSAARNAGVLSCSGPPANTLPPKAPPS